MRMPAVFLAIWMLPVVASAQVPTKIAYQGKLTDSSGAAIIGVQTMKFEIFDDLTAGTSKWSETQSVDFSDGYYSIFLGTSTSIDPSVFDGTARFLEVTVGSTKLSPRQPIVSVPYALVAGVATSLANKGTYVLNQGATPQSASFNIDGSGIIGTSLAVATPSPKAKVHAVGGAATTGSGLVSFLSSAAATLSGDASAKFLTEIAPGDIIVVNATSTTTQTSRVTAVTANDSLTVDVPWSGPGFVNRPYTIQKPVARFHSAGAATAGVMVNGAGNVGIGTNTPRLPLDVAGQVGVNGKPVILWQEFATPLLKEFRFTDSQTLNVTVSATMPAGARYILADVFVTADGDDHQNIVLGRGVTSQSTWVDPRGTQPSTVFGNLARHAVTLTYPGQGDGHTSNYGIWYSSQTIPLNANGTFDFNNWSNSGSKGWVYLVVRAYSL